MSPPTSAAAKFHNYRVFLQTYQWKTLDCNLPPELWGWTKSDAGLSPTMTDLPPAPDDLLKIIRCNCLTNCQNARCSCIKHGMKCSAACGHCHGSACSNASSFVMDEASSVFRLCGKSCYICKCETDMGIDSVPSQTCLNESTENLFSVLNG